jgi:hypothetical protein
MSTVFTWVHAVPGATPSCSAADIMKNVNKTDEYGELTEQQIQDARKRRARWDWRIPLTS